MKFLQSSIPSFFVLFLAVFTLTSCYEDSESTENFNPENSSNIPAVEAVQARFGALPLSERLSGTVIAKNQVSLYPEITGRIATYSKWRFC